MSTSTSHDHPPIVIERTYPASLEEVWELWTTRDGFEAWWGPQGFRADVHELDARAGGALRYDMVADSADMIAAMAAMGAPARQPVRARFTELTPRTHLVLTSVIDFLPGVAPYESTIVVDLAAEGDHVRMRVTLHGMHDAAHTRMQEEGFGSQLTKLDARFASRGA